MKCSEFKRKLYYSIKPALPRAVQIALRRRTILLQLPTVGAVWPIDPPAGAAPLGWGGWPSGKKFALVLTHDVESERGLERSIRLAGLERELGLKSAFNFVPERYPVNPRIRHELQENGFEVGVHDLRHDGRLYQSERTFSMNAVLINKYMKSWGCVGFRSASMYHRLEWMHYLRIEYDSSTFDTDPFEPQPDGLRSIFPAWIPGRGDGEGCVELPYTLPQDMTLFVLLRQKDTRIWKEKLEWIAEKGGMALLNTHPDYMNWTGEKAKVDEYPHEYYLEFLRFVLSKYHGQFWPALPREVAAFWKSSMVSPALQTNSGG
jgi:hypothetical protein